jgi:hypothetical protein
MPMAWLMSKLNEQEESKVDTLDEGPAEETINYWALRLTPFLERQSGEKPFYFINCNRTGTEQKSKFAGSSCALHFGRRQSKDEGTRPPVTLIGALGREEGVTIFHLP